MPVHAQPSSFSDRLMDMRKKFRLRLLALSEVVLGCHSVLRTCLAFECFWNLGKWEKYVPKMLGWIYAGNKSAYTRAHHSTAWTLKTLWMEGNIMLIHDPKQNRFKSSTDLLYTRNILSLGNKGLTCRNCFILSLANFIEISVLFSGLTLIH